MEQISEEFGWAQVSSKIEKNKAGFITGGCLCHFFLKFFIENCAGRLWLESSRFDFFWNFEVFLGFFVRIVVG